MCDYQALKCSIVVVEIVMMAFPMSVATMITATTNSDGDCSRGVRMRLMVVMVALAWDLFSSVVG
jgi:hypothetical protein